jgi:hypothetical protein
VSNGGVLVSGTNGIVVAISSGTVTLRGLDFEGIGSGLSGISVVTAGIVHVEKCLIRDFTTNGISFTPSTSGAQLTVDDTVITDNNSGTTGNAGILLRPTGGANANVTITNTRIFNGVNGIFADGSGGGGVLNVNVNNSVIGNQTNNGVTISQGSSTSFTGTVVGTLISYSFGSGVAVAGSASSLSIGGDTISNNVVGYAQVSGTLNTFKNNQIVNNGSNSGTLTTVGLQ